MNAPKKGIVISVCNDNATVKLTMHQSCNHCGACESPDLLLTIPNAMHAHVGDTIEIPSNHTTEMLVIFVEFVVPIVGILLGCVLGFYAAPIFKISTVLCMTVFCIVLFGTACGLAFRFDQAVGKSLLKTAKVQTP